MRAYRVACLVLSVLSAAAALHPSRSFAQTQAQVVSACGTLGSGVTYAAGRTYSLTQDTTGKLCDTGGGGGGGGSTANQGTQAASATGSTWFFQGAGAAGTPSGGVLSVQGVSGGTSLGVTDAQGAQAATATGNTWFFQGAGAAGTPSGGVLTVQGGVGGTALPVSGTVTTTPSGTQNVTGTGAAGTPATGVITVQGIASGTALSVTDTTSVAQGSTTSGQVGPLVQGTANSSIGVSYSNGTTQPLSFFTSGGGLAVGIVPSASPRAGLTPVVSASAEASHVLKSSSGNLYSVTATNLTTTAGFLAIVNATTAPTTGSAITPLACVPLPASGVANINYNPGPGATYSTGITALVSSNASCFTFTSGTITAFISGAVQ
jgi:hypothetical protein